MGDPPLGSKGVFYHKCLAIGKLTFTAILDLKTNPDGEFHRLLGGIKPRNWPAEESDPTRRVEGDTEMQDGRAATEELKRKRDGMSEVAERRATKKRCD